MLMVLKYFFSLVIINILDKFCNQNIKSPLEENYFGMQKSLILLGKQPGQILTNFVF